MTILLKIVHIFTGWITKQMRWDPTSLLVTIFFTFSSQCPIRGKCQRTCTRNNWRTTNRAWSHRGPRDRPNAQEWKLWLGLQFRSKPGLRDWPGHSGWPGSTGKRQTVARVGFWQVWKQAKAGNIWGHFITAGKCFSRWAKDQGTFECKYKICLTNKT